MSLLTDLMAWYELGEASGTRSDSHGARHLSESGTVGVAAGKVGNAADFDGGADWLSAADHADFDAFSSGGSFTVAAWIRVDSYTAGYLVAKWHEGTDGEWQLTAGGGSNYFAFATYNGSSAPGVSSGTFNYPALGAWSLVVAWFDSSTSDLHIRVNNGGVDTNTSGVTPRASTLPLTIGRDAVGGTFGGGSHDGQVDQVAIWARVLTSGEQAELYNGGAGLAYADLGGGGGASIPAIVHHMRMQGMA